MGPLLIIFLILFAFTLYYLYLGYRNNYQFPKKYNPHPQSEISYPDPLNADRFLASKIKDQNYDNIIIGSGLSGLSAASILSRCGQKCLVLEQHTVAGGWTQSFKRQGFEFDTGVHFVGSQMIEIFDWIAKKPFEWLTIGHQTKDDRHIFFVDHFDDKVIEVGQGIENFLSIIEKEFPDDKKAVEEYLSEIDLAMKYQMINNIFNMLLKWPIIGTFVRSLVLKKYKDKENISLEERLNQLKISLPVQKIFAEILGLLGLEPNETPYLMHLFMCKYSLSKQGSEDFAFQSIPIIYDNGGKVLVGKKVKQILLDKNQKSVIGMVQLLNNFFQGVQMNDRDNTIIKAKNVICACNFNLAIERLLPQQFQESPDYKYMKEKTSITPGTLFIFIGLFYLYKLISKGFNGSNEELGFTTACHNFNSIHYKDVAYDLDDLLNANTVSSIMFHSTKIKQWNEKYPNKSAAVMLITHKYEIFEKWAGTVPEKRGEDYKALKNRIAQAYIQKHLLKAFPNLKEKIAYTEVATSLTSEYFVEAYKGTSYGIKQNIARNDLRIKKFLNYQAYDVKGLFFCGQDIIGNGLFPSMLSGIFAASYILGYWTLKDMLTGRMIFKDFPNLLKHLQKEEEKKKKNE